MWKKEDAKPQGIPQISTAPVNSAIPASSTAIPSRENIIATPVSPKAAACVSQGIKIKGDVTGTEDLFIDGHIEGRLDLGNASLTIGPNGSVKADVTAREVIVRGCIEGKITGRERVQIWNTGKVEGEVISERIAIEDGAILRGRVEAGKMPVKSSEARGNLATTGSSKGSDVAAKAPAAKAAEGGTPASTGAASSAAD